MDGAADLERHMTAARHTTYTLWQQVWAEHGGCPQERALFQSYLALLSGDEVGRAVRSRINLTRKHPTP